MKRLSFERQSTQELFVADSLGKLFNLDTVTEVSQKKKLFSIQLSLGSYASIVERIIEISRRKNSSYVCVANVHMLIEALNDPKFAKVVNNADLVTTDGLPLTWGLKILHNIQQERVAGMDLLPDLIRKCETQCIPVYFYGGSEDMLNRTRSFIKTHYKNLLLAGLYSPPFRPLSHDEEFEVVERINKSGAKIVFVALGCPKQEKWMASMKGKVNALMIGVGGALPVFIQAQKRAPLWLQNLGMEWLFRLIQEPRRLWKRYCYTNSLFIYLVVRSKISALLRK